MMYLFSLLLVFIFPSSPNNTITTKDGGSLHYYNQGCLPADGSTCDIVIEKFTKTKELEWKTIVGGNSWDYIEMVLETEDGFIVLGNTSSYGQGNLDVYVTKLSPQGEQEWFKTYGGFFNDYGRTIAASSEHEGFFIEGQQQKCSTPNVSNDCYLESLYISIDPKGRVLGDKDN